MSIVDVYMQIDGFLLLSFQLFGGVAGFFSARLAWRPGLHAALRLLAWSAIVFAGIILSIFVSGLAAYLATGHLGDALRIGAKDSFLLVVAIMELGNLCSGGGLFLGVGIWMLSGVVSAGKRIYLGRHQPGGILNRNPIAKRWRVCYFLAGLWVLFSFLHGILSDYYRSDYYGNYISGAEFALLLITMFGPAALGLGIFWIYDHWVK